MVPATGSGYPAPELLAGSYAGSRWDTAAPPAGQGVLAADLAGHPYGGHQSAEVGGLG